MSEDPNRSPSAPADIARDEPEETAQRGPWGGSTFAYRGARIECLPGNHVCALFMAEHSLSGSSFGAPGTITLLVDLWIEKQQLPAYMRQ